MTIGAALTAGTVTSPSATALTIQSAGTTAMTVDTSQNVGIGTTSPGAKLNAYNNSAVVTELRAGNSVSYASILVDATGASQLYAPGGTQIFSVGGSERMRIDSSGNLLVGTTSSDARVNVKGSDSTSSNYAMFARNSSGTILFYTRNDGYFTTGLGSLSPYNFTTGNASNVYIDTNGGLLRSTSSLRYKNSIQNAAYGLADVLKLRAVTYKNNNDGDHVFGGFIAEEVDSAGLKEFVSYDKEGRPDALHYANMAALMAKAIQELSAKNDALEARLAALEAK